MTGPQRLREWWQRRWKHVLGAVACFVLGAVVRGFFPPFVLDDGFWRDFFSGPPAAGVFALIGAALAYMAAKVAAKTARTAAERQEWWNRAEWGLTLARSDKAVDRKVGLAALAPMLDEATQTEEAIIVAVTTAITGDVDSADDANGTVDTGPDMAENRAHGWRWLTWRRRRG